MASFHRPPDYDTNSDTVVRVTAGEVRKRLALTYHESDEHHAVQISLPAGSYVPEFYRQASTVEVAVASGDEDEAFGLELDPGTTALDLSIGIDPGQDPS